MNYNTFIENTKKIEYVTCGHCEKVFSYSLENPDIEVITRKEGGYFMRKYKRLELKTEKDFAIAEKLQTRGWKPILWESDYVLMEK